MTVLYRSPISSRSSGSFLLDLLCICRKKVVVADPEMTRRTNKVWIHSATEALAPDVRNDLVQEVVTTLDQCDESYQQNDNNGNKDDADVNTSSSHSGGNKDSSTLSAEQDIEQQLQFAQSQLEQAKEKEQFLTLRIEKYTRVLNKYKQNQKEKKNNNGEDEDDEEKNSGVDADKIKQLKEGLGQVINVHIDILMNIKQLEKQIGILEYKKTEYETLKEECHDFLVAAAASATIMEPEAQQALSGAIPQRREVKTIDDHDDHDSSKASNEDGDDIEVGGKLEFQPVSEKQTKKEEEETDQGIIDKTDNNSQQKSINYE